MFETYQVSNNGTTPVSTMTAIRSTLIEVGDQLFRHQQGAGIFEKMLTTHPLRSIRQNQPVK